MRRILAITAALGALAAALFVLGGAGGDDGGPRYTIEFDNAFGLVEGADVKVAGVRAGKIKSFDVDRRSKRALVEVELTQGGFGDLRRDVRCEIRPQSLIGEYFVDCAPGGAPERLKPGARIPVAQTGSTVPLDLVNNIMRRPRRERLSLLVAELGAAVGGRASDLNEAIRRASPALRETDAVLAKLARQNQTLRDLTQNADTVLADLAGNKRDVSRFVAEARDTARASAERKAQIAAGFRELPGFLRELKPTMAELGKVADAQVPALNDLSAAASDLETLFTRLDPFGKATQVNLASLAKAAAIGRGAVRKAQPAVKELRSAATDMPELANNLAIVLNDLNDRDRAVEKDPRAPEGKGYTGLEALLQYVYDQVQAINIYDQNGYILKVNAFHDRCADYQNAESVKAEEGLLEECHAWLGPNQQGITTPDPTRSRRPAAKRERKTSRKRTQRTRRAPAPGNIEPARTPQPTAAPKPTATPDQVQGIVNGLTDTLKDIIGDPGKLLPDGLGTDGELLPDVLRQRDALAPHSTAERQALLDWLMGS